MSQEKIIACPSCGTNNHIIFNRDEDTRRVPCIGCYLERPDEVLVDFTDTQINKQGEEETVNGKRLEYNKAHDGSYLMKKSGVILTLKLDGTAEIAESFDA